MLSLPLSHKYSMCFSHHVLRAPFLRSHLSLPVNRTRVDWRAPLARMISSVLTDGYNYIRRSELNVKWETQTYCFESSRRLRKTSGGVLAKEREIERGRGGADTTPAGEFEGGQVAQHGGEMGEANDWCRLHGLALQLSVLPSWATLAVTCGCSPSSPPYRLHAAKWRIYISIHSSFDPGRIRPSLETLITVGLIGARFLFLDNASGV